MKTIEDFQDHELIKTDKIFWLLDHAPSRGYGWPLPVYFDRTSSIYRVFCPSHHEGVYFETSELPPLGPFQFEVPEPIQFAKDVHLTTINVIVKEI